MTKLVQMIRVHGDYRAPVGFTFKYKPGKLAAGEGAKPEEFFVTDTGVVMHDDAAVVAKALYPDDFLVTDVTPTAPAEGAGEDGADKTAAEGAATKPTRKVATVDVENPGDISKLELPDLKALAKHRKIKGRSKMKKAALIEALS